MILVVKQDPVTDYSQGSLGAGYIIRAIVYVLKLMQVLLFGHFDLGHVRIFHINVELCQLLSMILVSPTEWAILFRT